MIRISRPDIDDRDVEAVEQVLRSGFLVQGARVAEFEAALVEAVGAQHAVAVANGTAALQLSLQACGIGPGDEVAVPTFTFPATANAVVLAGATPRFVDIEGDTLGMDPEALRRHLAVSPRIRAIMPVHAFGRLAQIEEIARIAEDAALPLIEDAACALGAHRAGRAAGTWGALGCFSFHPRKAATTGEGGAVVTDDATLAARLRTLRNHGMDAASALPDFIDAGHNLRLTEFQAALGRSQLARHAAMVATRRARSARYAELLDGLPVTLPCEVTAGEHCWQSYVVLLDTELAASRDRILAQLREHEIEANIGTYHVPLLSYYRRTLGHKPGDHPVGEDVAARTMALPMHSLLTDDEQERVARALRAVLRT